MDSFHVNTIKFEKPRGKQKCNQLRKLTNLFRVIEVCVILIIFSRFTSQLPIVAKFSSELFHDLALFLVSPRFVFLLGNAIVITLFIKSGQFSSQDADKKKLEFDTYQEFTENVAKSQGIDRAEYKKQSICEEKIVQVDTSPSLDMKVYRRSQSDNFNYAKPRHVLRRTATDTGQKSITYGEKVVQKTYPEDDMSNEEFKHKIEAFIARQQRILRGEEYSAFVY